MTDGHRVIVCGSRSWSDVAAIWDRLDALKRPVIIVHGGCHGADMAARGWVQTLIYCGVRGVSEIAFLANWQSHGRKAGPLRNQAMADAGADLCIAFWDGSSRGTRDMIRRAEAAGIPVEIVAP